jgi:hypothetical protein
MANYTFQPNEVLLLSESNVIHGGLMAKPTDDLILTNVNLVLAKKGIFGNGKGVMTFPLSQIKVWDGRAQVMLGKARNGRPALEVFFIDGQETFAFQSGGKRKIAEWVNRISQAVTGTVLPTPPQPAGVALGRRRERRSRSGLPRTEAVAGALAHTFKVFKTEFGPSPEAPQQVSGKCRSCGATVSGTRGQQVTCGYCDTPQEL